MVPRFLPNFGADCSPITARLVINILKVDPKYICALDCMSQDGDDDGSGNSMMLVMAVIIVIEKPQ